MNSVIKEAEILKRGAESARVFRSDLDNLNAGMLTYAGERLENHPGATGGMTQHALGIARYYLRRELDVLRSAMRAAAGQPRYSDYKAKAKEIEELLA